MYMFNRFIKTGLSLLLICVLILIPTYSTNAAQTDKTDSSVEETDGNLYLDALEQETIINTKTDTVRRGDFRIGFSVEARLEIKSGAAIMNIDSVGDVSFGNYVVSIGDWVEPGDVICTVSVSVDKEQIATLESEIALEEEKLAEYSDTNEKLLEEYETQIRNGQGDVRQAKLLRDRLSVDFKKEKESRQNYIDSLRSEYERYLVAEMTDSIKSYAPGVVGYLNRYTRGQKLKNWEFMGTIYGSEDVRFFIDSGNDYMRFNLPITLVQQAGSGMNEFPGKVVTSLDSSLPASLCGSVNYIEVEGDITTLNPNRKTMIRCDRALQENVLLVKNSAVYNDSRGKYVLVDVNGLKTRRYVVVGGSNNEDTWIIDGVNEGETVLIK